MRFRAIDKVLLVIVLLLVIALALGLFGIATNLITQSMLVYWAGVITNGMIENILILAAIGLVLLIFALRLFIAMGKKNSKAAERQPSAALVLEGEGGSAFITIDAIDSMVQRHCRNNNKIKECESNVRATEAGVSISLKLAALNETVIPDLSREIQQSLKENIETLTGINVKEINVLVVASPPASKPRVS